MQKNWSFVLAGTYWLLTLVFRFFELPAPELLSSNDVTADFLITLVSIGGLLHISLAVLKMQKEIQRLGIILVLVGASGFLLALLLGQPTLFYVIFFFGGCANLTTLKVK